MWVFFLKNIANFEGLSENHLVFWRCDNFYFQKMPTKRKIVTEKKNSIPIWVWMNGAKPIAGSHQNIALQHIAFVNKKSLKMKTFYYYSFLQKNYCSIVHITLVLKN